jgi:hypothetical protein
MRWVHALCGVTVLVLISPLAVLAQSSQSNPSVPVPRLINIAGTFRPADGQPPSAVETVTLSIYAEPEAGSPLWQETQTVTLDERGRYSLLLGATLADGIPPAVFASGGAHWLSTRFERPGEAEGSRVRITSVPYALRASDADTLGGRPASDYLLASTTGTSEVRAAATTSTQEPSVAAPNAVLAGGTNYLAKYVNSSDVGNSALYETGGQMGLGTTLPLDAFHVVFNNTFGGATGLAVQNLGNTATSYSGMLFYDQNGALGQFQGFNNSTHEYRINNVARNAGQFNGSINFMVGSTSRFFVGSTGNIGIGTNAPQGSLEVVRGGEAMVIASSYGGEGSTFKSRGARGTPLAPTALLAGDGLGAFGLTGCATTGFGDFNAGFGALAAELDRHGSGNRAGVRHDTARDSGPSALYGHPAGRECRHRNTG